MPASVEGIGVVEIAMTRVAAIEVVAAEIVAIDDRSTMGDVGVVVINHRPAVPVISPVIPAPSKSSKEPDSKSKPEGDCRAGKKDSRHGIPAREGDDRRPVYEPRIVGRHVDHVRVGRFDDDGAALGRYFFLFVAVQLARLASLLAQCLDGLRHILLLVGIGVPKG